MCRDGDGGDEVSLSGEGQEEFSDAEDGRLMGPVDDRDGEEERRFGDELERVGVVVM